MKGILFTQDNLKATIELRKTQTRRVIKPVAHGESWLLLKWGGDTYYMPQDKDALIKYSRYQVGEVVYIKEAWRVYDVDTRSLNDKEFHVKVEYKDDFTKWGYIPHTTSFTIPDKWHSPMMLPAKAARYFITIEDVRAERLQEISPHEISTHDLLAEGLPKHNFGIDYTSKLERYVLLEDFKELWNSINKPPYDWASNPWVFVYTYSLNKGE